MRTLYFFLLVILNLSISKLAFCQIEVIDNSSDFYGATFTYKENLYLSKNFMLTKWDGNTFTSFQNNYNDYGFKNFLFEYKGIAYCNYITTKTLSDDNYVSVSSIMSFDGNQINLVKDGIKTIGEIIKYRDTVYFTELGYNNTNNSFNLIKFDGNNFTPICELRNDIYGTQPVIYGAQPVIYRDTLFFRILNKSGIYQLAKYCNGKTQIIKNPDEGSRFSGCSAEQPVVIHDSLYIIYKNKDDLPQFAKYWNNELKLINNPDNGKIFMVNSIQLKDTIYFTYRNELGKYSLASFDGKSIKLYPQHDDGSNIYANTIVFNNYLYFTYINSQKQVQLLKFDGNELVMVSKIDNALFNLNTPNITKNAVYFRFQTDNSIYNLIKFDGTELKILKNPDNNDGYYDPISYVFNDTLFFCYRGSGSLALCGGQKVELAKDIQHGITMGKFFEFNNKLYFHYYFNAKECIATFNYNSSEIISQIPNNLLNNNQPKIYPNPVSNNKLFISNCKNESKIEVFNIQGQSVLNTIVHDNAPIDISSLPIGVFYIKIENDDNKPTKLKFLKVMH